ncbi:MAG: CrcB family protein [Myxococcales bacterium]|nr:CrcB family protein [Myxococcales bacterium]
MSMWRLAFAVFVGSGLGGVSRWGIALWSARTLAARFASPWPALVGTLTVNLVGSLLLGWLVAREHSGTGIEHAALRLGLMTGFMGGFTTYSTFNTEVLTLMTGGRSKEAVMYMGLTAALCLIGGAVGMGLVGR